jgi:hypothetical protein
MRLGASLIQGFYIARPSAEVTENKLRQKVSDVNEAYSKILKNMQLEEKRFHEMGEEAESLFCSFVNNAQNIKNWTQSGSRLLEELPSVEALYLIDDENKQVGDTLIKSRTRPFYEPTKDGYDYSLKEYYMRAKNAIDGKYLTEPYLSLASGSLCRTYASRISISQTSYVLCIDFAIGN